MQCCSCIILRSDHKTIISTKFVVFLLGTICHSAVLSTDSEDKVEDDSAIEEATRHIKNKQGSSCEDHEYHQKKS